MPPENPEATLETELKRLLVEAADKPVDPDTIADDDTLVGRGSRLGLDSLDVLQVNVALNNRYGVRIQDSKHARRVMRTIRDLAVFVRAGE